MQMTLPENMSFTDVMKQVLDLQKSWAKENTPQMIQRGQLIRRIGPNMLEALLPSLSITLFFSPSVEGRDGTGAKTRVPWIRIFDKTLSPSATMGWYIVFLFAADGHAVFLSLNQGTTIVRKGAYKNRPVRLLMERAENARSLIAPTRDNRLEDKINLQDPKGLGRQYEYGNVVAYCYTSNELPNVFLLKKDIETMLKMLDKLYELERNRTMDTRENEVNSEPQSVLNEEILQPEEDKLASKASTIKCKVDDFRTLLSLFIDFSRASRLDIDLTTSIDVLAATLSCQFVLFAGPSGTGKSSLARLLARFFTTDESWRILEARRQWIGPEDAFGYYSPFTGHYALTPNTADLTALHRASSRWLHLESDADSVDVGIPILLVEEANLSPIEGYLSPIIHGISSPSTLYVGVQLHAKASGATDPENVFTIPSSLLLGPFPRFFGTINVDPTSQAPARKVSARANVILLEPAEQFDPIGAATFLSTIGTLDTANETLPISGQGRSWIGDPASARVACTEAELQELTNALSLLLERIGDELAMTTEEDSRVISISRRDLERCANYMAYFVRLAEVASDSEIDRTILLALAAENALFHIVLPNLPAYDFRSCVAALLGDGVINAPSLDPNRLGGLLLPRLRRIQASANGLVFAEALDFWACLS